MTTRLLALALALAACNDTTPLPDGGNDAASTGTDAGGFTIDAPNYDAPQPPPPPVPDAAAPPPEACVQDGGPACPLPPSVCADTNYLEYFENGVCVDGGCQFDSKLFLCTAGCVHGACQNGGFTAPVH